MIVCHFVAAEPGVFRCSHPGCINALWATDAAQLRPGRCRMQPRDLLGQPCQHLGDATGESYRCRGCPGSPRIHALFACAQHGACLPLTQAKHTRCCATCSDYQPQESAS